MPPDVLPDLLNTKFYIPGPQIGWVVRPRLLSRLDQSLACPLTVISAPAGYGKSTLLSQWASTLRDIPFAMIQMDEEDNDPVHFLAGLFRGMEGLCRGVTETARALLLTSQPAMPRIILGALLADLQHLTRPVVLALDDYHVIHSPIVQDAAVYLLTNLPPMVHLIFSSRSEPALPLARMRVRNQLVDIRIDDMAFTRDEALDFLNHSMGLIIRESDAALLSTRTEGWAAGLQLAALSLKNHAHPHQFVTGFSGRSHHVFDYFLEEVIANQPEDVQEFLLRTACMERFCAGLCQVITGQEDSEQRLAELVRQNLFLIPLDEKHTWFRFHPLFAEALRGQLNRRHPGMESSLHCCASKWFIQNHFQEDAIHHALAGCSYEISADLIETCAVEFVRQGRISTIQHWVFQLPDETMNTHPRLGLISAQASMLTGDLNGAQNRLEQTEIALNHLPEPARSMLTGYWHAISATIAMFRGDVDETIRNANRALDLLPPEDSGQRCLAYLNLGDAEMMAGNMAQAADALEDTIRLGLSSNNLYVAMIAFSNLSECCQVQGQLREAYQVLERARNLLERKVSGRYALLPASSLIFSGMAGIQREWNDLETARRIDALAFELAQQSNFMVALAESYSGMAHDACIRGDIAEALTLLEQGLLSLQGPESSLFATLLKTYRARLWIQTGTPEGIAAARRWASERKLDEDRNISYANELERITLARLWEAEGNLDAACQLLDQLISLLWRSGRLGRALQAQILQSIVLANLNQTEKAHAILREALELGERQGYLRRFVEEGAPMYALLESFAASTTQPVSLRQYARRLLEAFSIGNRSAPVQPEMAEALSERELEVLNWLALGATNHEIAEALVLSMGTVKAHLNHIMNKLGVRNRTEAVLRAQALGLMQTKP